MVKVNFSFADGLRPQIAMNIQENINQRFMDDEAIDNNINLNIALEYRGDGFLNSSNFSMKVPIETNKRILEIIFEEIRDGGLIPV